MKGRKPATFVPGTLATVPNAPSWLSKDAKAEWRRIMPDLVERRILSDADVGLLEDLCVARGRIREFERAIQAAAPEIDPKMIRMQDKAIQTARQIAAELGVTPVSRSRPTIRNDQSDDDQHLSDLGL